MCKASVYKSDYMTENEGWESNAGWVDGVKDQSGRGGWPHIFFSLILNVVHQHELDIRY